MSLITLSMSRNRPLRLKSLFCVSEKFWWFRWFRYLDTRGILVTSASGNNRFLIIQTNHWTAFIIATARRDQFDKRLIIRALIKSQSRYLVITAAIIDFRQRHNFGNVSDLSMNYYRGNGKFLVLILFVTSSLLAKRICYRVFIVNFEAIKE